DGIYAIPGVLSTYPRALDFDLGSVHDEFIFLASEWFIVNANEDAVGWNVRLVDSRMPQISGIPLREPFGLVAVGGPGQSAHAPERRARDTSIECEWTRTRERIAESQQSLAV